MAYDEPPPPEERPGCLEVLLITRAVFGILLWPMVVIFAVAFDVAVTLLLFVTYAPLALLPVAVTVIAVWLFARWERSRSRPPGL